MFSLQKRKHTRTFMDNRFILNRQKHVNQNFEEPKNNTSSQLEKHLVKIPVENFSNQASGVDIIKPQMNPIIETTNSKIVNEISKGIKAENLCSDTTIVPEEKKQEPVDNNFIVTKKTNCINPEVEQKLLHTVIKKSKKSKNHLTVYDF